MTAQDISAIHLSRATGWKDEGRRNQSIRIPAPDGVLRLPVKHAQHPVMAGQIGYVIGSNNGSELTGDATHTRTSSQSAPMIATS